MNRNDQRLLTVVRQKLLWKEREVKASDALSRSINKRKTENLVESDYERELHNYIEAREKVLEFEELERAWDRGEDIIYAKLRGPRDEPIQFVWQ